MGIPIYGGVEVYVISAALVVGPLLGAAFLLFLFRRLLRVGAWLFDAGQRRLARVEQKWTSSRQRKESAIVGRTENVGQRRRSSTALPASDGIHRRHGEWRDSASSIGAIWRRRSTIVALILSFSSSMSLFDGAAALSNEAAVAKVAKERNDNAPSGNSDQEMPSKKLS